jgi:hypothetical protein
LYEPETKTTYARTLWDYLRQGLIEAHKRRPLSFYLLLLVPLVMLLGVHIADYRNSPLRFATMLGLMFVFFWLITIRAFNDLFGMIRKHRAEKRNLYLETIGDKAFVESLGAKVKQSDGSQKNNC